MGGNVDWRGNYCYRALPASHQSLMFKALLITGATCLGLWCYFLASTPWTQPIHAIIYDHVPLP